MKHSIPLQITDLSVDIKRRRLFASVSLCLEAGQLVSLMGANGVGKTTLIETLLGYHQPLSGEILFWGKRLEKSEPSRLFSRLAFVSSSQERYPSASTVTDLFHSLEKAYSSWNPELVQTLLQGFEIRNNLKLNGMSLGESTKIRLIKALAFEPELLLLDELTANLSPDSKTAVLSVLFDLLPKKNMAVLYVCHSLEEAMSLSDRIVVLGPQGLSERKN